MRLTTDSTVRRRACIPARISAWIRRRQRKLSDRLHAAGDERARQHGWQVTKTTGRFGFGARSYRDPRFDARRRQHSAGTAQVDGGREEQATTTLERRQIEQGGEPEPEEYVPPAAPDTSRCIPPSVYNAIGDYARKVNRPGHGPDGAPYMAPEEPAFLAEWLGEGRAGSGSVEDRIVGWNEANDYCNEANEYETDRKPGE